MDNVYISSVFNQQNLTVGTLRLACAILELDFIFDFGLFIAVYADIHKILNRYTIKKSRSYRDTLFILEICKQLIMCTAFLSKQEESYTNNFSVEHC